MPTKREIIEIALLTDTESKKHRNNEAISEATGASIAYIKRIRSRMFLSKQIPYRGEFVIASIMAQHEEGRKPVAIAKALGKHESYVRRVIKRYAR